jgi:hypothetical protein
MIIKNIAKLCKKSSTIRLTEKVVTKKSFGQWIGDNRGIYLITDLPLMTEQEIMTVLDIPEKDRESKMINYIPRHSMALLTDNEESEQPIKSTGFPQLKIGSNVYNLIETGEGTMIFVKKEYLEPLKDSMEKGTLRLYTRSGEFGETYLVVKQGMFIEALIEPEDIIKEAVVNVLQRLYTGSLEALKRKREQEQTEYRLETRQQISLEDDDIEIEESEEE